MPQRGGEIRGRRACLALACLVFTCAEPLSQPLPALRRSRAVQPPPRAPRPAALFAARPADKGSATTVGLLFAGCTTLSLVTDMLTKSILKRDSGLAFATTFFHFGVPTAAGLLALPFAARRAKSDGAELSLGFDRRELGAIAVLAICQALGFFFTNLSLQAVAVSFSHTVKACECLFTATLAWLVLGQTFSLLTYASLLPVAAGVALSAVSELQFSLFGFAAAMGSNACFAMRSVLSSNVFARGRVGPIALYILLCAGALGYLALSAALTGGLLSAFSGARPLLPPMFLCGATHFSYNVLSFMILARTSPITHVVLHAVRRLIVIGASSAFAGNAITRWNWLGVGIATTGVIGYAWSQTLPQPEAKDA